MSKFKKNGNTRHSQKYVSFDGIISKTPIKNNINSRILIKTNNSLLKKIFNNTSNFEKYFSVYSVDKQEAENFINANIKEQLLQLYEEYELPFEISIKDNYIYIRLFTGPIFENTTSLFSTYNKKRLYDDYIILKNIFDMIKKINNILNSTLELGN